MKIKINEMKAIRNLMGHKPRRPILTKNHVMVCPICESPYFEANHNPGTHIFKKYYCKHHKGFFRKPTIKFFIKRVA